MSKNELYDRFIVIDVKDYLVLKHGKDAVSVLILPLYSILPYL